MKNKLLNSLTKTQLRELAGKAFTLDQKKLNRMSKEKCLDKLVNSELSYKQIVALLNNN